MIWLYRILYLPLFLLLIPYYLRRMFRRGGYLPMMRERFGWVEFPPKRSGDRKRVWIQAVSVGELLAIGPLIQRLRSSADWDVFVSTTTSTGYAMAKETYRKDAAHVFAFPLDFWPFVRRAWLRVAPDLVILTEGEMWPEHLHQAKKRGIPSVLINARISDRTSARLKAMPFGVSIMHGCVSAIGAASTMDADRILALGIPQNRVRVTGNLKFDAVDGAKVSDEEIEAMCADAGWNMQDDHRVVIGASTWSGEEKLIIDAMCALRSEGAKLRLILV
ncbi:MAG: 3-deoxy-D-manno-octulosonic acid transferase, partial [Opitutales bacterium]|nr:3-deoxy-D-manno-octulosonic acid transferase [Opitutales bacterium]